MVNCSQRGLKDMPSDLPYNTRLLFLDRNSIASWGESATFQNLSLLQVLDLSHNKIPTLKDAFFINLGNLQILDLSFNSIHVTGRDAFVGLSELQCLNLSFNPLPPLQHGFFSPLVRLTELNLTSTRVAFVPEAFLNVTNLRKFVFRQNRLLKFPKFLYHNASLFPKLVELYLSRNSLESFNSFGLDSLEFMTVGSNKIDAMHAYTLSHFKNLKSISLFDNMLRRITPSAFCSKTLRKLDLSFSRFILSVKTRNVFNCIPNLEELQLINIQVSRVRHPFRNLTKLKKLNMGGTGIGDVEVMTMLPDLKRLEWLSLSHNTIHKLRRGVFANFAKTLKVLALGSNRITTLNITSLPETLWTTLEKIDLSDNPFTCDCQLVWFLRWLSTTNVTISKWQKDPKQYQCTAPAPLRKKSLKFLKHPNERDCFEAPMDWCLLSVFLISLAASASSSIGSVLYRFRWYVKYWYFKYKIQQRQEALSSDNRTYQYDAFVSYSKHDTHWVVSELRRHLETEEGLQLCIHDRDFIVGEDIVSNVISSIEQSRKVLFIVSNAFAVSQWCHFELIMVQTRMLENDRDNLVLILLEEIDDANLSPRLKLQMEKQTYLEWTSSEIGRQLFWDRLRQAVGRPPESVINSHLPMEMFR